MNVLIVEPGFLPYEKEINGLEEMQQTVGGYIQAIYPYDDMVALVCDDEGLFKGYPFNRSIEGGYGGICGTFFVCGLSEDNFASLSPELMKKYKEKFKKAELLLGAKGNEAITFKYDAVPKGKKPKLKEHGPER